MSARYTDSIEDETDDNDTDLTHLRGDDEITSDHTNMSQRQIHSQRPKVDSHINSSQSKRTRHHAHLMLQMSAPSGASRRLSGLSSATSHAESHRSTIASASVHSGARSPDPASSGHSSLDIASAFEECQNDKDDFDDTSDLEVSFQCRLLFHVFYFLLLTVSVYYFSCEQDDDDVAFPHLACTKRLPRLSYEELSFVAAMTVASTDFSSASPVSNRSLASPVPLHFARAQSPSGSYTGYNTHSHSHSSHAQFRSLSQNNIGSRDSSHTTQTRQVCLESLFQVHQKYQLPPDCLHAAVYMFYRHMVSLGQQTSLSISPGQPSPFLARYDSFRSDSSQAWTSDDRVNHGYLIALVCLAAACQLTQSVNASSPVIFGVDQCCVESQQNYSREQVLELLQTMLNHWITTEAVQFNLSSSTGYAHLARYCSHLRVCDATAHLATYYLEQCLFHQSLMGEASPSQMAAGCLFAALCRQQSEQDLLSTPVNMTMTGQQVQELLRVSELSSQTVSALASEIIRYLTLQHTSGFRLVHEKYSGSQYHFVATLTLPNVI